MLQYMTAEELGVIMAWITVIGLGLTAAGVIVGFYLPTMGSEWLKDEAEAKAVEAKEWRRKVRAFAGATMVVVGTIMQIYTVCVAALGS